MSYSEWETKLIFVPIFEHKCIKDYSLISSIKKNKLNLKLAKVSFDINVIKSEKLR